MPSGTIQSRGTTPMSWQIWFVVARNKIEAHAERLPHKRYLPFPGRAPSVLSVDTTSCGSISGRRLATPRLALYIQLAANTKYSKDQSHACELNVSPGSSSAGNASSDRKEPKFEREYSR